jgi:protein gp37
MAQNSNIEWTHDTFNPWWGCVKVSPACDHCYAERFSNRWVKPTLWGSNAPRRFFGDKHWQQPLRWNKAALKAGERRRVFCASMADVFEDRSDLVSYRARLFEIIAETSQLDWLLLTKRPENIIRMLPCPLPRNAWLGTTAENQVAWDIRLPLLLAVPAAVRFVSAEPLLGPITMNGNIPDWLIVGGECGPGARPIESAWVESLCEQCSRDKVPFFFKQWGGVHKKKKGRELGGRT